MLRIFGACCIGISCAGFGFSMAAASRREEAELRQLVSALEYMSCELSYRMTPLGAMCMRAAENCTGTVRAFLRGLAQTLEQRTEPEVRDCIAQLLEQLQPPRLLERQLRELGTTLGRFDLPGQLRGLESAIRSAEDALRTCREGADGRRRCWQTLGLCAGAALVILFI